MEIIIHNIVVILTHDGENWKSEELGCPETSYK